MGSYKEAQPLFERALQIGEATLGSEHPAVASILTGLGNVMRGIGDYSRATSHYERARDILEKYIGDEDRALAFNLAGLGILHRYSGRYSEAKSLLESALRIWKDTIDPESVHLGFIHFELAMLHASQGRQAEAADHHKRAQGILMKRPGKEHPKVLLCQARYMALGGNREETLHYVRRFLDLDQANARILHEPDLAHLEGDPEFESLVVRAKNSIRTDR
jgi:tetratricopeptide (TPR) repeat protein